MTFSLAMRDTTMTATGETERTRCVMNEEEFRAFYERTARPLWAYLSRLTGSAQRADDFLQETYYRFYRAGTEYADESHRRNSLFRIATNLVRDSARHDGRHPEVELDEESAMHRLGGIDVSRPERQAAIRTDLGRALGHLAPVQRELLWLAYAQGVSHQEIAQILGVRAISVRTLLLRARRKLARLLAGVSVVEKVESR